MFLNLNEDEKTEGIKKELTSGSYALKITSFLGNFDGNGYQIKGINYDDTSDSQYALFGSNSGTIKDLTIEGNINIIPTMGLSDVRAAGFATHNTGTIKNCINKIYITVNMENAIEQGANVGGIVAQNIYTLDSTANTVLSGKIENCKNYGTITIVTQESMMAINTITHSETEGIINCTNSGTIKRVNPTVSMPLRTVNAGQIVGSAVSEGGEASSGSRDTD